MFERSNRGGTRGGAADFSWDVVKEDKHRENYLGNSVAAPRGRWAQGRDILWYSKGHKDDTDKDQAKRKEELLAIKMAEQEAMNQLLGQSGQARTKRAPHVGNALTQGSQETAQRTGANAAPIDPTKRRYPAPGSPTEPRSPRRHDERHRSRHEDRRRRHRHDRDKRYERDTDRRRERDYERRHEREVSPHRRPRHDEAERSRRER